MVSGGERGRESIESRGSECALLRGVQCLIVEDHPVLLRQMGRLLRRAGATSEQATNVLEACSALEAGVFDIVLLDLNLSGASGTPVARAARESSSRPILLVVTGDPDFVDIRELQDLGAIVVMKVNVAGNLVGIVHGLIDGHRASTVPPPSRSGARPIVSVRTTRDAAPFTARERALLERLEACDVLSTEIVACEFLGRGANNIGNANAVQKFMSRLRAKLEASGEARVIECVYGGGYRLRMSAVSDSCRGRAAPRRSR